jgi:nitrogenase-stabilizing/protective protein
MLAEAISTIEVAEDLFSLLGETYSPDTLRVHRLHILKRFGMEVAMLERRDPPPSEDERAVLYAQALRRAHDLYARGGADAEPLFRPRPKPTLVTLGRRTGNT